ncbi:MAG: MerR family transcriptional regulator, partial [Ruminococcus sp.]
MSKYTTGEIANLCGVSVRTVQYYDKRGILVPSELSEGGRRIYSEDDLKQMKIICFLRELDLPINSISEILNEENHGEIIRLLLEKQEKILAEEITERQEKLRSLEALSRYAGRTKDFSVKSIGDIACSMNNKNKRKRTIGLILAAGIIMDIIEVATIVLWIMKGIWLPFALGMCVVILIGALATWYYLRSMAYVCPQCHETFIPSKKA